jgi:hypothetical protein
MTDKEQIEKLKAEVDHLKMLVKRQNKIIRKMLEVIQSEKHNS